jgi:hypothetical protein
MSTWLWVPQIHDTFAAHTSIMSLLDAADALDAIASGRIPRRGPVLAGAMVQRRAQVP